MDERRRVDELDRHGAAHHARRRRRRRRRAPRAAGAAACRPRRSCRVGVLGQHRAAVAAAISQQPLLDARQQRADVRRRRRRTISVTGSVRGAGHALAPDVDGDDAARREDPADVAQAGARPSPRPGPRGRGSASRSWAGRCRRRESPASRPSAGTTRSNHTRKNVDSGGRCGVVISRIDDPAARAHDARHLGRPRSRSEKLRAPKPTVAASKRSSRRAAPARWPTPSVIAGLPSRARRARASPRRSRSPIDLARRATASSIARSPVPVATSSTRRPAPTRGQVGRPRAPAVVQPGGHDRVHQVVDRRRCGRTSPAPASSGRVPAWAPARAILAHFSCDRNVTRC